MGMSLGRFMLGLGMDMELELGGLGVKVVRVVGVEGFRHDIVSYWKWERGGFYTREVMIDEL